LPISWFPKKKLFLPKFHSFVHFLALFSFILANFYISVVKNAFETIYLKDLNSYLMNKEIKKKNEEDEEESEKLNC